MHDDADDDMMVMVPDENLEVSMDDVFGMALCHCPQQLRDYDLSIVFLETLSLLIASMVHELVSVVTIVVKTIAMVMIMLMLVVMLVSYGVYGFVCFIFAHYIQEFSSFHAE